MDRPGHIIPWGQRTQRPLPDNLAVSNGATGTELPCSRSGDIPGTHRTALTDELGLSVHRLVFVAWASAREPQEFPPGQRRESIRPPLYWRSLVKVLRRFGTEPRLGIVCQNRPPAELEPCRYDRSRVVIPSVSRTRTLLLALAPRKRSTPKARPSPMAVARSSCRDLELITPFKGSNDFNLGRGNPDSGPLV